MNEINLGGEATLVKDNLPNFMGRAQLWQVVPPLENNSYVVVSAVIAMFSGPETYIFASNAEGKVNDWGELDGSFKGELNHEKALRMAGYDTLIYPEAAQ